MPPTIFRRFLECDLEMCFHFYLIIAYHVTSIWINLPRTVIQSPRRLWVLKYVAIGVELG